MALNRIEFAVVEQAAEVGFDGGWLGLAVGELTGEGGGAAGVDIADLFEADGFEAGEAEGMGGAAVSGADEAEQDGVAR